MGAKNSRLGVAILHKSARMHHADVAKIYKNISRKRALGSNILNISF